jgi:hypothetical protein
MRRSLCTLVLVAVAVIGASGALLGQESRPPAEGGLTYSLSQPPKFKWYGGFGMGAYLEGSSNEFVERQQGGGDPTTDEQKETEFLLAPGFAVTLPVGPLRFVAEAQYYLAGDPGFYEGFNSNSLVLSARVVVSIPVKIYPVAM